MVFDPRDKYKDLDQIKRGQLDETAREALPKTIFWPEDDGGDMSSLLFIRQKNSVAGDATLNITTKGGWRSTDSCESVC
jgi:hypothetical protein